MYWLAGLVGLAGLAAWQWSVRSPSVSLDQLVLSPQIVVIDPRSINVMGKDGSFRTEAFKTHFNPTNAALPHIQIFDPSFLSVLGSSPSINLVASVPGIPFAHEAPVWHPDTDQVFFSSHCGEDLGWGSCDENNYISKMEMKEVYTALSGASDVTSAVNVSVTALDIPDARQMTWGATGPYHSNLLLINSGRGELPSSLTLVNPAPPHNVTVLLDNFYGRPFNSLNDGKIHPKSHKIFFTDVTYGYLKHFRPLPSMPNQVYRFDPDTGHVRVVTDVLMRPNGLAFSQDGKIAYVGDTGASAGFLGRNQTNPAAIYEFDVDPKTQVFTNPRIFAFIDTGLPDGIQVDTMGNVYSSCGDGVHVWNKDGILIGKFFTGTVSCNLVFAGPGKLVILAQTKVYLAQIAAKGTKLAYP
ncbi:uncharacterized protein FIBRA_04368 [Fibroporia radiculosa]|uniref:SMP-30/Gluconolactonase/LRE-like region domain-containing protein n=1 Tax=Fibroporia radiculosa TaxID=599839 RepID=J4IA47_9APHY|nr:uncharacterized protein FIBRA_04368 [Fibroporia radiculosa]CCM02281.1 predicted protein [Fibroporia radiculosa]